MRTFLRCFAFVILLSVPVARATIGLGLQLQLGNPSSATANPANPGNFLLDRAQMALSYNNTTREPNWVSWSLTSATDVGTVDRSDFLPDPDLPAGFYAVTTQEYNGVGAIRIDRGHMSPSKDRTITTTDNQVVFYMTNIVPQAADNNQGPWALFEDYCRQISSLGNEVLIICGPSGFGATTIPSGVVFTPFAVWKIAVVVPLGPGPALSRINASTRVIALKMPNVNGIRTVPWTDYITSAAEIESDTGYQFFSTLDPAIAAALRVKVDGGATGTGLPVIAGQPASQTAVVGGNVTFAVTATSSTALTYQWRKDGDEISGATASALTLTAVSLAAAGSYDVQVTNSVGSAVSNPAVLTVSAPVAPTITTQPLAQTVPAGATATFTAAAAGVPTPTLQWFKGTSAIAGATTGTLTLTNVQPADNDLYSVTATNSAGSATSNAVALTVTPTPPTIITQPVSLSAPLGGSAAFSVVAGGSARLAYQWRKNGTPIAAATTASLALANVQTTDGGSYDVVVSNAASAVASSLAVLSVTAAGTSPSGDILWNFSVATPSSGLPADVTGGTVSVGNNNGTTTLLTSSSVSSGYTGASGTNNAGAAARIGALNTGAGGSAYFEFTLNPGAKALSVTALSFGSRSTSTGPKAYSLFTSANGFAAAIAEGTLQSDSVWRLITPALTAPNTGAVGAPVTIRIYGHSGTGSASANTANWRIDDLKVTVFTSTSAATTPTVAISSTSPAANAAQVAITTPLSLTFNVPVTVTGTWFSVASALHGPVPVVVSGGPGTFTLTPTSSLAHNDTITVNVFAAQVADQATGTGRPTSNYSYAFTTVAPTAPSILTHPKPQIVVVGGTAIFSATATGTAPLTYQWRKGTTNLSDVAGSISGATTPTLTLTNVALADAGSYSVAVNNPANTPAISNAAPLTVSTTPVAPVIITQPVAQIVSAGGTASFSVTATGSTPLQYQWRRAGVPLANGPGVSGATSDTLTLTAVTPGHMAGYDVVVSNGTLPDATSVTAVLTVNTAAGLSLLNYTGGYAVQRFDTLPASGSFSPPGNGPFSLDAPVASGGVAAAGTAGWSYAKYAGSGSTAAFRVNTGSDTAGGVISYGSAGSTERALGSLASGSNVSRLGVMLVNNTGQSISQFTVRYVGEQWRRGGSTSANKLTFAYGVGATDINTGSFTSVATLDFTAPVTAATTGALNGNADASRATILAPVSGVSWGVGQVLVLRWSDEDNDSSDDGLAIDDVVFTTDSLVAPVIASQPASQSVVYGTPVTLSVTASGTPAPTYQWRKDGVTIAGATQASFTLAAAAVADSGAYTCVVSNLAADVTTAAATLLVTKAPASITLAGLTRTYDGTPQAATATTTPAGLTVTFTYDGSASAPTNAGAYAVVATINDANYTGSASGTLMIGKAPAVIAFTGLSQIYDGTPRLVTATTTPAGLSVALTYNGAALAPTTAGSYAVAATVNEPNYTGSATATLTVAPAAATIVIGNLIQAYDGLPKPAAIATTPAGLATTVTYDGSATPPSLPGSYAVAATIANANYTGSATGTLVVTITALVRHAPTIDGGLDGSLQVLLGENLTLNGNAWISGDLLVPGSPALQLNGQPTIAGTLDGDGAAAPSNYRVTLSGKAVLRYLVRRTDPIALPVVAAPPAPAGTRNVTLNQAGDSAGDFATLRHLTLNGNLAPVAVPPGTYGSLTANGNSGFILGIIGATTPAVYNLQNLTLNGSSQLTIVGPVVLNLANGFTVNGAIGDAIPTDWLVLNIASGGLTLNGNAAVTATVVAPAGAITLTGASTLRGRIIADRLTINGNGLLTTAAP